MSDYIVRATAADGYIRAFACITTKTVEEARNLHDLSPTASAALGRTISAAVMMARQLKNEKDNLTIQIKGDGPLGGIVTVTDHEANVRGYVYNSYVHVGLNNKGKLNVSGAIGSNGYLNVIKDMGLKEPYIGRVPLVSGEIAEDIAYYYACSEQVPSVVALGVLVGADNEIKNSGGYIIQLMPGADESLIDFLEKKVADIPSVTEMLSSGMTLEDILQSLLGEKNLNISEIFPCKYLCNCSRERMEKNLVSIGPKDIIEILEEQGEAELCCHFCNKKYLFTEEDLRKILLDNIGWAPERGKKSGNQPS